MSRRWDNQEILNELLLTIIRNIYDFESLSIESFRKMCATSSDVELKEYIINLRLDSILTLITLIDGDTGPSDWPGVKLVNAKTNQELAAELAWEFSRVEGKFLESDSGNSG